MKLLAALTMVAIGACLGTAAASPTPGQDSAGVAMVEFESSRPPVGYVQFCNQYPQDCRGGVMSARRPELTPERWRELVSVNDWVNEAIEPITDQELYGVAEHWTYPVNQGDCEEYVLLKRKLLIERGWPVNSLLITVVRDERGDGHAVLTVPTDSGDLVLDNQHAEIRLWSDTPYDFLKRQSGSDANRWVSLRDDQPGPQYPVAGTQHR